MVTFTPNSVQYALPQIIDCQAYCSNCLFYANICPHLENICYYVMKLQFHGELVLKWCYIRASCETPKTQCVRISNAMVYLN